MLERTRATACLDCGVRISLRSQRRALKSRRLLHQEFWHHGSADLDPVPPPPFAVSPLSPLQPSQQQRQQQQQQQQQQRQQQQQQQHHRQRLPLSAPRPGSLPPSDGPFLDFLYPASTLALISRGATQQSHGHLDRIWDRRCARRTDSPSGLRGYSSMTASSSTAEAPPPEHTPHRTVSLSSDITSERGAARTWSQYTALTAEQQHQPRLIRKLVDWYTSSTTADAHLRVLQLYDKLNEEDRTSLAFASKYEPAVERAVQRHIVALEQLRTQQKTIPQGMIAASATIMRHGILTGNWDLVLEFLTGFEANSPDRHVLWHELPRVVDIDKRILDLITYYKESQYESVRLTIRHLIEVLWPQVVRVSIANPAFLVASKPGRALRAQLRSTVRSMYAAQLNSSSVFEDCIKQLCSVSNGAVILDVNSLVNVIYTLYARLPQFKPSVALLRYMIDLWRNYTLALGIKPTKTRDYGLNVLLEHWETYHGRINDESLVTVMDTFARFGDVESVKSYAQLYKSFYPEGLTDSAKLWPLVTVHAQRSDAAGAAKQVDKMKEEYGVEPDLKCWNILIHACQEGDDLNAAVDAVDKLLQTGLKPDDYTLGSFIDVYAKRGEVDRVMDILDAAKVYKVEPSASMMNGLIVALATSDDIEGAEDVLEYTIKDFRAKGTLDSLTVPFNTVLTAYALRRDIDSTMKVYRRMRDDNVPLDSHSYAALIQVLCFYRQTDAAYKVLTNIMPKKNIRPEAFHYAIIMAGFVNQDMFKQALHVGKNMDEAKIKPSTSSRFARIKATALLEHSKRSIGGKVQPGIPLEDTIRDFVEMLEDSTVLNPVATRPLPGFRHGSSSAPLSAHFLIFIHGKQRAYEAVRRILLDYTKRLAEHGEEISMGSMPIRFITALMSVHLRQRDYADVDRCWALIRQQAERLRLNQPNFMPLKNPLSPAGFPPNQLSRHRRGVPLAQHSFRGPRISPAYRFLLSRPMRYYLSSQLAQHRPAALISLISDLLATGYAFENRTWNAYIVALCSMSPPRVALAFTLAEKHLMPDWPGWLPSKSGTMLNTTIQPKPSARAEGLEYTRARYLRPGQLAPQYKTMVHLASALLALRDIDAAGGVLTREPGMSNAEFRALQRNVGSAGVLSRVAPRTLEAVQAMPKVHDRLQTRLIMKEGA